jgi:hypothetical protein
MVGATHQQSTSHYPIAKPPFKQRHINTSVVIAPLLPVILADAGNHKKNAKPTRVLPTTLIDVGHRAFKKAFFKKGLFRVGTLFSLIG